jgi:hypothetical protein
VRHTDDTRLLAAVGSAAPKANGEKTKARKAAKDRETYARAKAIRPEVVALLATQPHLAGRRWPTPTFLAGSNRAKKTPKIIKDAIRRAKSLE